MDSQDSGLTVRDALPSEDAGLSILYANAFIDTWNRTKTRSTPSNSYLTFLFLQTTGSPKRPPFLSSMTLNPSLPRNSRAASSTPP